MWPSHAPLIISKNLDQTKIRSEGIKLHEKEDSTQLDELSKNIGNLIVDIC